MKTKKITEPNPKKMSKKIVRSKTRWIWTLFGLTGVGLVSATAGAMLAVSLASTPLLQTKLSAEDAAIFGNSRIASSSLRLPELTRPVNILILGVKVTISDLSKVPEELKDVRHDALVDSFDGQADTMLLVRFDPDQQKATLLSIPRDTKITTPRHGEMKINATNAQGGPALSAKAVSELLEDIPIDRYVRVNVQGVEKLVDALGGVTVYVPKDMKYVDKYQHLYIDLKQGKHHLNGNQALQLLRFRQDKLGDIGRIQRQQMVMRALTEQALTPSTVAKLPEILGVIRQHIDTNLSIEEFLALTGFMSKIDRSKMEMLMVPGSFNGDGHKSVSYWLPSRRQIKKMMAENFDQGLVSDEIQPRSATRMMIAIQDSTNSPKLVARLEAILREQGYRNIYIDEEPFGEPLKVTRLVAQQGDRSAAQNFQEKLGLGEVRVESTGNIASDITIQIGEDLVNNPDAIKGLQTTPAN